MLWLFCSIQHVCLLGPLVVDVSVVPIFCLHSTFQYNAINWMLIMYGFGDGYTLITLQHRMINIV